MEDKNLTLATFVGIDAHSTEHTALAINRFEEEKGRLAFENSFEGIAKFLNWLPTIEAENNNLLVGVEGGGNERHALVRNLLKKYSQVYEINPLYTKQRRDSGTRADKSDARDAKLIAEVVTKKTAELPIITPNQLSGTRLALRKTVWFYEETTDLGARIQLQLAQLNRESKLAEDKKEQRVLNFIIRTKKADLARVRKTQRQQIAQLAKVLPPEAKNLTSMRGISTVLAAKLVAHTDGIERFSNLDKFIRYAGISPLEKSSGRTKRYIKANRGNRRLNATLYLVALNQLAHSPKAREYFAKKVAEGKTKKHALRCLMKRVACIAYGVMKSGRPYEEK
jgi:transposase